MTPSEYARKVIEDYGKMLDYTDPGVREELQCKLMVLAGMVLTLDQAKQPKIKDRKAG